MIRPAKLIISRTDNLGDVILTLPLAGILKQHFPQLIIVFLGKKYTAPLMDNAEFIDEFINWDDLLQQNEQQKVDFFKALNADTILHVFPNRDIAGIAKKAGIKYRVGTSHRWYHWLYCNKRINLGRRNSNLHEAQLNIKLLAPFIENTSFATDEIHRFYGFSNIPLGEGPLFSLIQPDKFNLILHPKSKGSAREWSLDHYSELISLLGTEQYNIFITGTTEERILLRDFLIKHKDNVHDVTGQFKLSEFIQFVNQTDGLIAASTGPLHIAAALQKVALGIYPPIQPMHPGRWKPIGEKATSLVVDKKCNKCRKSIHCECIQEVTPTLVYQKLKSVIG